MRGPRTSEILKGSLHRGPIFGLLVVLIFLVLSQTLSPFLKGVNAFFCLLAILLMASSCAANGSSLLRIRLCIRCSIEGYFVFLNVIGMVLGDSPSIS